MKLNRREFLSLAGKSAAGAVIFSACGLPENELIVQAPEEMPEDLVRGEDAWYATTLGDFPGNDGVIVRVMEGRAKKIAGNPDHPISKGKSNARYDSMLQMLYHPDRLREPLNRYSKGGNLDGIGWKKAENIFRNALSESKNITLVTNQLRGHNGLVAEKFTENFGGKHIIFDPLNHGILHDTVKNVFSVNSLPYFDIGNAKTIMSFGADWLSTWISPVHYSKCYGDFRSQSGRGYFIHVDPRMSMTAANSDLWLPANPGTEGDLALCIARIIIEEQLVDQENIKNYQKYMPPGYLNGYQVRDVSLRTSIPSEKIHKSAKQIAQKTPSIVFGGGNAEAHTNGSFNMRAIYGLNILLGSIGKKGGILPNPESVSGLPAISKPSTLETIEEEISHWRAGNVDTVIIRGVDLVHGLPNHVDITGALSKVKNVIVFKTILDNTSSQADLILPESTFLESWGSDIPEPSPGYEVLSLQQPVVSPNSSNITKESRSFGDTLLSLTDGALGLGGKSIESLINSTTKQILENRNGSVKVDDNIKNDRPKLFLEGVLQRGGWWNTQFSGNISGNYKVSSKGNEYSVSPPPKFSNTNNLGEGDEFTLIPFVSNSLLNGELSSTPWAQQNPDPMSTAAWTTWAEINNKEAKKLGIDEGDILFVKSSSGEIEVLAYPHPGVKPGTICIPTGQGKESNGRFSSGLGANIFSILTPQKDLESGALAWAATKVKVQRSGRKRKVAKFEGTVEARPVEPGVPILVLGPNETVHDAEIANHHKHQSQFLGNEHLDPDKNNHSNKNTDSDGH
tara:strand:- start:2207 stop:4588 length:2382 start_codon:yes stop_codon:yes gene_type:complete